MKLTPILTEKSMNDAKEGRYTFWVGMHLNKFQIKELVESTFKVKVKSVKVIKKGGEIKKTNTRRIKSFLPQKKAIVKLGEKDKIDLFEEIKKSKKKK